MCDPNYGRDNQGATAQHQPIDIYPEEEVLHGPLSSYNLDFSVTLPPNPYEFRVFGPNLDYLTRPFDSAVGPDSITFGLSYSEAPQEIAEPNMTRWHITLKVSPASKLLYTYRAIRMPFRCSMKDMCQLAEETTAVKKVHQCITCKDHIVCHDCWMFAEWDHIHSNFEEVDLIQEEFKAQGSESHDMFPSERRRSDVTLVSGDGVSRDMVLSDQRACEEAQSRKRAKGPQSLSSGRSLSQGTRAGGDTDSVSEGGSSDERRTFTWEDILQSTASEAEKLAQLSSSVIPHDMEDPELFTYIGPAGHSLAPGA